MAARVYFVLGKRRSVRSGTKCYRFSTGSSLPSTRAKATKEADAAGFYPAVLHLRPPGRWQNLPIFLMLYANSCRMISDEA
jgi:hypothetical protein